MTPWESLLFSIHQCYSSETTKRGRETEIKSEKEGRGGYILCISIISPPPLQEIFFFSLTHAGGAEGGAKIWKFSTLKDELGCAGERSPPRENFEAFNFKR